MSALARASMPGRTCPVSYRYSPKVFDRAPEIEAPAMYVIGGLYGNVEALREIERLAAGESVAPVLVFNGDFHWFDVDAADFAAIDDAVLGHRAIRGNVETELARDGGDAGCGCAYPEDVGDAEVARSNQIIERLRDTARAQPQRRQRLGALPMHLVARVAGARIGIVHGDATSLAGWGFAHDRLSAPAHERWVENVFRDANVDVFACTHTCLPAYRHFGFGVVANNGAAGMPNLAGQRYGLVTRVAATPHPRALERFSLRVAGACVEALPVQYEHARWLERFLASWPAGTPAHASYHRRIVEGPRFAA